MVAAAVGAVGGGGGASAQIILDTRCALSVWRT